ncbi:SDR family NAD(P)-dependent oxidoreductase [Sorangium sp. So ce269]
MTLGRSRCRARRHDPARCGGRSPPWGKPHARQRRATLDALRRRGAAVEYHAIDVRDGERLDALIAGVYRRFGRLDAVVHGAGVIEDQLLADKRADSFDRVFDTKADSTFVLGQALRPDGLRWCVLFSSISGRFGNRGQSDYAAGNEVMSHLAAQLDVRWPGTRVVSIGWGPWREVGMAGEGVLRRLAAQGIVPVDVEAGCRFLFEELSRGSKGDVVVVAGEGPWRRGDGAAGAASEAGQGAVPAAGEDAAPEAGQGAAPAAGEDAAPVAGQEGAAQAAE